MNSLTVSTNALKASPLPTILSVRVLQGRAWLLSLFSVIALLALNG
jgi:hypothetical protein